MVATKGLMDHLFMAACEWFLMFWMFIDAALAYSLTRFAKKCQLQIPCLLCSRLDHFFGNEEPGSCSHLHLFCNKHQMDLSYLIYCNLHNKLVDAREMCERCFNSVTLQRESKFDCYKFGVGTKGNQLNKNLVGVSCSCCKSQWKEKSIGQRSIQPNVVGSRTSSKVTTKPPLPRVARHCRSKRMRNKMRNRQRDASFPIGHPELKFTSDSEFEFLFSDDDDRNFKVRGISERNSKDERNDGNRYKILGRRTYSTPDLGSAFLVNAQSNRNSRTRTRTRTRARSASLTPNFLTRHSLTELNRRNAENDSFNSKGPLSSMNSTRLWIDSLNKTSGYGSIDGSMASCSNGSQNRYNVFSRNSFSASDLRSALVLEAHYNKSLPRRSASLTPNCYNRHGLGDLNRKESELLKGKKGKKPLSSTNSTCISTTLPSTDSYGSLDASLLACSSGSQNRYKIFSRNSFSASDLGSAVLLEIHNNRSLPRRSASLTPNSSPGYHLGEQQKSTRHVPLKAKKNKKLGSSSHVRSSVPPSYGYLDDSVISHNKGNQHKIPRRHSCSVFHLGGDILLNMPNDESLTSRCALLAQNGMPNSSINRQGSSSDFRSDFSTAYIDKSKEYGFLDDSVVSRTTGMQYQNNIPRRHSYSFFELGCEILLNMPFNESVTTCSTSFTPNGSNGYNFGEPKNFNFQDWPSPSLNVMQFPCRKAKRGKKSRQSLNRTSGYKSFDDLFVSHNTGSSNQNNNTRRHSYSAFELGCALLLDMPPFDENLTNKSVSSHSHNQHLPPRSSVRTFSSSLDAINDLTRSFDDSVVSRRTGNHIHYQNQIPRRHSYSVFQLGGDILLNMPVDESLTSRSTPNDFRFHSLGDSQRSHFQKGENDKKSLPPTSSVKRFISSSDVRSDIPIDKTKWHGSFDDYLVSRSTSNKIQNNNPRRHSYSAFDLGHALLGEVHLDNSLKNSPASFGPNGSTGQSSGKHNRAHNHHHHKLKRENKALPPPCPINWPCSSSHARHDHFTTSSNKAHGGRSFDDFGVSHKTGNHTDNQNNNPRRHSYSAFELECALLLNMQRDASSKCRSASVTPKIQTFPTVSRSLDMGTLITTQFGQPKVIESQHLKSKKDEHSLVSMNTLISDSSSTSLYKPHLYGSYDDSFLSQSKDGPKQNTNLRRSYYSASDLTSPFVLQMNLDENLTSGSTSLTPNILNDQGLGELHLLKFETGTSSSLQKHKKGDRPKGKKNKKPSLTTNNVDKTDKYESFEISNDAGSQSRYKIFSRNSQSASDLGSVLLLEMHHDESSSSRSKSLTPECYFRSPGTDSLNVMQFSVKEPQEKYSPEVEKDKKRTKEVNSPNSIKSDLCPACLDKIDLRSLDGSSVSEIEYEGLEKVKRKAEDDVRCMRLLQSELEAERNAATVAANHAMNMITRLQQEKASLQMEALQYLRMMEEQAEYDMEALQKANELVEEKENEIQDLLDELEQYRIKYGDEAMDIIKSFEDEKRYILESLSTLEKKIHQLSNGVNNEEKVQSGHLKDENNLSANKGSSSSNGVHDKSQESDNHVDSNKVFATLEHEISGLKEKMEALQADLDLLKHACNTLRGSEGLEFIQEIAHQLQDLRVKMFDGKYVSSS